MNMHSHHHTEKEESTASVLQQRRNSLAISALLNDVSIDPLQHPLAPNKQLEDVYSTQETSPTSSGASTPSDHSRQSSVDMTVDFLWNHSRTGMHHSDNGSIIISSLTKAKRKRILPYQYNRLMEIFNDTDTPSSEVRNILANELDMTKREVQVWFQNRRAKINKSIKRRLSEEAYYRRRSSASISRQSLSSCLPNKRPSLVLESPYQPVNSAIDLLATAAEMMRQN